MTACLSVTGLRHAFGGREVLNLQSLEIESGETLCVMGPNGAGKSTLIRILNLVEKAHAGELRFRGDRVGPGSGEARRRMAAVFQHPHMFRGTVAANVAYGLKLRRLPRAEVKARVSQAIEELGLSHLRDQDARRLSGGEAQRVALARAIVLQPDLLFLDEPAANLDSEARESLHRDLRRIARGGGSTVIYVTHSPAEVQACGDRLAVLIEGGLRQIGPIREVFQAPADDAVARLIGGNSPAPDDNHICPHCGLESILVK